MMQLFQSSSEFKNIFGSPTNPVSLAPFNPLLSLSHVMNHAWYQSLIFQSSSEFKVAQISAELMDAISFQSSSEFKCSSTNFLYLLSLPFNPLLSLSEVIRCTIPSLENIFQSSSEFKKW